MKKFNIGRNLLLLVLVFLASTHCSFAQTEGNANASKSFYADSLHSIGEVEVFGSRPLATVQTLSGVELQSLSTTTIADALKYFAGVQIKDYGGLGGLKTINVRSLGAQHVGVAV